MNANRNKRVGWVALAVGLLAACATTPPPPVAVQPGAVMTPPDELVLPVDPYEELAHVIEAHIGEIDWGGGKVALLVEDAERPFTICAVEPGRLVRPAGTMKLLTASAALDRLGPQYRFVTELRVEDPPEATPGVVRTLIVRGSGDPSIPRRDPERPEEDNRLLDRWADLLYARGIRRVEGAILGDDRAFDRQWYAAGWPEGRDGDPAQPCIAALNFNRNCVDVRWRKRRWGGNGRLARYTLWPDVPDFPIFTNEVHYTSGRGRPRRFDRAEGGNYIVARGDVPLGRAVCDQAAVADPARLFAEAFKRRLIERGIDVEGPALGASAMAPSELPRRTRLLDVHLSPPLIELFVDMMARDAALEAEVAFKAMGAQTVERRAASFSDGARVVEDFVQALRLPGAPPVVVDGSGLSVLDRLSPAHLVALMRHMRVSTRGDEFARLLPERSGRVRAHWSAAEGAQSVAGRLTTTDGESWLFAVMVDGSEASEAQLRHGIQTLLDEFLAFGMSAGVEAAQ